jgi:hypothetical protein
MSSLTDRQHRILTFERQWWNRADACIGELFDCGLEEYERELAELLALPAALIYDPLLVRRLRGKAVAPRVARSHPAGRARLQ